MPPFSAILDEFANTLRRCTITQMATTRLQTKHLKTIIAVLLLFAVLALSSCALFQPPNKYATQVRGRVTIEGATDYSGINVQVRYYDRDAGSNIILDAMVTDSLGYFTMADIPLIPGGVDYSVYAWKSGYADADDTFSIYYGYDGSPFVFNNVKLHCQKKIVFDWAWKEGDGSSFVGSVTGHDKLYSYVRASKRSTRFDFDCAAGANCYDTDIGFYDDEDHTAFYPWENRLWDVGEVPLSSVASAPSSGGARWSYVTLTVGHTYVVSTDQGYAKFHVISIGNAE